MRPCAVQTCPCLAAAGGDYCTAHRDGWRAPAPAPQPCPICHKAIKTKQMVFPYHGFIAHVPCIEEANRQ